MTDEVKKEETQEVKYLIEKRPVIIKLENGAEFSIPEGVNYEGAIAILDIFKQILVERSKMDEESVKKEVVEEVPVEKEVKELKK